MTDDVKGWIPSLYLDEWVPSPRATPEDWLVLGEVVRIAGLDEDDVPGPVIAQGDVVNFDLNTDFGDARLVIHNEGFTVSPAMPAAANCVRFAYDNEIIAESVEQLVEQFREAGDGTLGDTMDVQYYAWDSHEFRLEGVRLVAVLAP